MRKTANNTQRIEKLEEQMTVVMSGIEDIKKMLASSSTTTTSSKKSTTSKKKSVSKSAKEQAPKQTREERLTEKYGSLEERTKWAKARTEGYQTLHEVIGHDDYYALKKNERNELATKFADARVASPKKSAKTIVKEILKK